MSEAAIIVYGADWCGDCHRVKHLFEVHGLPFEYRNIDEDEKAKQAMLDLVDGKNEIPVILVGDKVLQNPTNAELLKELKVEQPKVETHDVVMIGAGPAALAAAIYTTREDIDTVLFEKGVIGGLAAITDWIDNYPGFPKGLAGLDLADGLREQAERFGADIRLGEVTDIQDAGMYKRLVTTEGDFYARAVLIATGSDYKKIGVPGEQEYYARGVHYCATCDGAFYRDKHIVVVGGGNSAVQEAMFLTRFAKQIDILVRGPEFRASEVLQHELEKHKDKITVHFNTTTDEIVGDGKTVNAVHGTDTTTGKKVTFKTDGVFVFVGLKPNTEFLRNTQIELDEIGFVKTDAHLKTSMDGVFAAGDVRSGATMQIATATGEGATAALKVREYLEGHNH